MTSDDGGFAWEQGRALERAVEAMRVGDLDGMAAALADFAAALGTRTTSMLSGMLIPILEQLRALRETRESDIRMRDHKLDLLIVAVERISDATLADTIDAAARARLIDQIRRIPALEQRVDALEQQSGASDEP